MRPISWKERTVRLCLFTLVTHLSIFLMFTLSFFSVPYDSTKAFVWEDYLTACGAKAVPASVFKQVRVFYKTKRKHKV